MPHTVDHARRLMRELLPLLPEKAEIVLERPSYWDPGFAERFFDYTEDLIFHEPRAAVAVAGVARRLAYVMPEEEGLAGRRKYRERLVRAYSLVGSALRATGRAKEAEKPYRAALGLCDGGIVSSSCRGELYLKLAILRAYQKRYEEAERLVELAEGIFEPRKEQVWRGLLLATRGAVFVFANKFPEAISALTQALGLYKLSSRLEYSATANLAYAVLRTEQPAGLQDALRYLRRARKLAGPRRSVQKSFLYWTEGLIFVRLGSTGRAEQRFNKALQGFVKFETPYEIALVGLDLSALLCFARRWSELEVLASDTYRRFRDLQEDTEALAALKLWLEAVRNQTLTVELVDEVKAKLEERKQRRRS